MKRVVPFSVLLTCLGVGIIAFWGLDGRSRLDTSSNMRTWMAMKDIRIALESYRVEYGHFPGQAIQVHASDVRVTTVGPLVDCLMGEKSEWNPKAIRFVEFPDARGGKFGYLPAVGDLPSQVVDLWGQPYVILLDTDGDQRIRNPDATNSDTALFLMPTSPPPAFLPLETAVYSFGKDQAGSTGDDIVSWRLSYPTPDSAF